MSKLSAEDLRELRRIHVAAGRRVDALLAGDWRSAVRGRGMEFEEVRAYVPGDDVRHIDWNVTARSGDAFVKVFREERQMTVLLVVDVSGSTKVGSGGEDGRTDRRLQVARIAGGIAYAGIRSRDEVGLVTFSDRIETWLRPRRTRGHVWAVIQAIFEASGERRGTSIAEAARFVAATWRRRAVVVIVSDFLDPGPWQSAIATLAGRHQVHAILVHDPLDDALPVGGLVEVEDAETGRRMLVDASTIRPQPDVDARLRALRRSGARAAAVSTSEDAFRALHEHFRQVGAHR